MRTDWTISAWVVLATVMVSSASAQGRGGGRGGALQTLNANATVMTVSPRALEVSTDVGQKWIVSIPARPEEVVFRGSASLEFLQPGMAVRFHTTFRKSDKRHKEYQALQPVSKLEIITPLPTSPPNVYPDDAAGLDNLFQRKNEDQREGREGKEEERERRKEVEQERRKEREAEKERRGKEKDADADEGTGEEMACLVIGLVREFKNNKLKVSAGQIPVTADLLDTTEVSVDVHHCQWVRPGDKVELTARFSPMTPGQAMGQRLTITAAAPLGPDEKAAKGHRHGREKDTPEASKKLDNQGKQ